MISFTSRPVVEDDDSKPEVKDQFYFARNNQWEELKKALAASTIDATDSEGLTTLHYAVDSGHIALVRALIKGKADINAQDSDGCTPLHFACICEEPTIIKMLVELGADMNVKDNDGETPKQLMKDLGLCAS